MREFIFAKSARHAVDRETASSRHHRRMLEDLRPRCRCPQRGQVSQRKRRCTVTTNSPSSKRTPMTRSPWILRNLLSSVEARTDGPFLWGSTRRAATERTRRRR
jgi:hypothetical protein